MIHIYEDTVDDIGYDEDVYVHDGVNYFLKGILTGNLSTGENVLLVIPGVVKGNIYMGKNSILNASGILGGGKVYLNEGVYVDLCGIVDNLKLNGGFFDLNCMLKGEIEE